MGRPAGRQIFRFPCGHVEDGDTVDHRTRVTERAVWVRCRACNVIGLLVARPGRREPAESATRQRP